MFINDFKGGRPIAYRVIGKLHVGSVWGIEHEKLLKFTFASPELHVRPHKSDSQTEFFYHKSPLDGYVNKDFYAHWNYGKIEAVYIAENEPEALVNLKKGLMSLFQYQLLDGDLAEVDISGECLANYVSTSSTSYQKLKKNCKPLNGTVLFGRTEVPLGVTVDSYRSTSYKVTPHGSLDTVENRDFHAIRLQANRNVGGAVDSLLQLEWNGVEGKVAVIDVETIEEALKSIDWLKKQSLYVDASVVNSGSSDEPVSFKAVVKERLSDLEQSNLGKIGSAFTLVDILPAASKANQKEILQVLKARSTQDILVSFISSSNAHHFFF